MLGSKNKVNNIRAAMIALENLKDQQEIRNLRK